MVLVLGVVVIFAALAFVAYPLIKTSRQDAVIEDELESELQRKKESTYSALKELEFDYELGNLSPEDHRDLEERYKEKAVKILKDMDAAGEKTAGREEPDLSGADDVEREILMARGRKEIGIEDEIMDARGVKEAGISCPSCNRKVSSSAKYCSSCGSVVSVSCPSCGERAKKGDKFCPGCGEKLV